MRRINSFFTRFELYHAYKDDPYKYVYVHITADTDDVFYVGCGARRRACALHGRNKKWKRIVDEHGLKVMIVCDRMTDQQAYELEMDLIEYYQAQNPELNCNFSLGGPGGSYGIKQSEDWIRKRVSAHGYDGFSQRMLGNHYAKTVQIDMEELKRLKDAGWTNRALTQHFNCSEETIRRRLLAMR